MRINGRMRTTCVLLALLGAGFGAAAHPAGDPVEADVSTEAKPWTSLDLNNDPSMFQFVVVTDNAGGPREDIFGEAMAKINLLQPEFVINIGDLIEGYENSAEQLNAQWDRVMEKIHRLEMPFFFVPGNHDNGRPLWAEVYNSRFGVPYYHFLYKDVLFLCLCTNDAPENETGIGDEQVAYAAKVLSEHPDVRWTFVFQHKPLWNAKEKEKDPGWIKIAELLKGRKCTVFAGHTHNYLSQEAEGISFITLATTGGGTGLRGPAYGEMDEIAWVTMTNEGPRVANLLLDGILDKDYRTFEKALTLKPFNEGKAITASPVLLPAGPFASGASKLTIENPAETPLRVKVLSETPAGMRVEPSTVTTVVPGKGKQEVEFRITSDKPMPVEQVQPVILHWEANYDTGDNKPSTRLEGECRIPFETPFVVPVREDAPNVDGKVDEWGELPFVVDQPGEVWHNAAAWKGPQDGSFRFGVARDGEYLYVAIKTRDNDLCFDGWKYWEDFASVLIDARASEKDDPDKTIFGAFVGPKIDPNQVEEFTIGTLPEGLKSASVATSDGFEAEVAIPLAYLNERQGGNWQRIRLNVGFGDFDRSDAREGVTVLYWRPSWKKEGDYPEKGVFVAAPATATAQATPAP